MNKKRKVTKKIAAWLLCLAMVLTTVNLPAFQTEVQAAACDGANHNFSDNGTCVCGITQITYEVIGDTKTVRVTGPNEAVDQTGDLVIPSTVRIDGEDYSVTEIRDDAFYFCKFTGNLTIPDSVTTIGACTFSNCGFTGNLVLGNSVTTIDDFAFGDCGFTGSLTIPDSVTTIGNCAFACCHNIEGISIPCSVKNIGEKIFLSNTSFVVNPTVKVTPGSVAETYVKENYPDLTVDATGTHHFSVKVNETTHKCANCDAIETHKFSSDCDTTCNDCGHVIDGATGNHHFTEMVNYASHRCTDCGTISDHELNNYGICVCGYRTKINIPSFTAFATKTDLVNPDKFTLHIDNGKGVAQKVNFGNGKTWYIAGKDIYKGYGRDDGQTESLALMCDPANPFAEDVLFNESKDKIEYRLYEDTAFIANNANGSMVSKFEKMEVYLNHYGASDIRKNLIGLYEDNNYDVFTSEEQAIMMPCFFLTEDLKNNIGAYDEMYNYLMYNFLYITMDKLYLAQGEYDDKNPKTYITVGTNRFDDLNCGIKIGLTSDNGSSGSPYIDSRNGTFWLRTPYDTPSGWHVLYAKCGESTDGLEAFNSDREYIHNSVVPVLQLKLDNILFASSATVATANASFSDAMTFRMNGTDKVTGTAVYDTDGVKVTKGEDGEYIYIQYREDNIDKVWSKAITDNMNIFTDCVGIDSFAHCKIWIEKKVTEENLTYAVMATSGDTGITGHPFNITETKHSCQICGKEEIHSFNENTDFEIVNENTHKWSCLICGGIAIGNHDFSKQEYIQVTGNMHKQKCKYCDVYSSPEACSGGTATCTKKAVCEICKKEYGEIDADNHTPTTPVKENLVPATCDTDGSYDSVVYCSECEKELSRETKPETKVGHTWNADYTVDVEATTTKEGSKSIHCSICGAIKEGSTVTIPKKEAQNPTQAPTTDPSASPTDKPSGKPSSTVAPTARPTSAAVVKPAKAKIASAKNNKKKIITVKIKKAKNAKSYRIQYATDKKFKKAKTKNSKNLTVTLKGLKKKKTYYIRVCGVNGKVVGAWSSVKKVKVKK